MSYATADLRCPPARRLSGGAFPWLLSTTVHLLLFIGLLAALNWGHRLGAPFGSGRGVQILLGSDQARDEAAGLDEIDLAPYLGGGVPIDEPAAPPEPLEASTPPGGNSPPIESPLAEKPKIALASTQRATAEDRGQGNGQGTGTGSSDAAPAAAAKSPASARGPIGGGYARTGIFVRWARAASSPTSSIARAAWTAMPARR